jgi:hypothetical protein
VRLRFASAAMLGAFLATGGAALAGPQPASPQASCVAVITSYEASQLDPGSVGTEVSGFATSAPGLGSDVVNGLARQHDGSIDACREAEG